jgi:hypothetical protein
MKRRIVLCLGLVALFAVPVLAQEGQDQEAAMKAWMESAKAGPSHKMLADMAGTWEVNATSYDNPKSPTTSKGSAVKTMMMDGRFLKEELTGEMMGMPFNGFGITGFNNTTRKFETIWLDSMGTMIMTGSGEGENGTCTVLMDFVDPMSKQKMTAKGVTKVVDANKHVYTMYLMVGGKEMKTMEAEYIRKK